MRKIINLSAAIIFVASCNQKKPIEPEKNDIHQKECFDINKAKDVDWHPIYSGYSSPKLQSDGQYFESGSFVGNWSFPNNCDCVVVKNQNIPANNFYFKIKRLTNDTFEVYTARFGINLFYK